MNKCVPYLSYSYTKSLFAHIMQDILQIRLINKIYKASCIKMC